MRVIRALTELRADINTPNEAGRFPVHIAAKEGQVEVIRALAGLGADVNTLNKYGGTPVFVAASTDNVNAVRVLSEVGADVNIPTENGCTPVFIAAQEDNVDSIRALVKLGANVDTPMNDDHTPMHVAALQGQVEAIRALTGMRAGIDKGSNQNPSPLLAVLHNVGFNNRRQSSLCLVNNGAGVRECFTAEHTHPSETELITDRMTQLFDSVSLNNNHSYDGAATSAAKCSLFSLTKLMSSATRGDYTPDESDHAVDDGEEQNSEEPNVFEIAIASSLQQHMSVAVVTQPERYTSFSNACSAYVRYAGGYYILRRTYYFVKAM